jgi:hypothetical protein
MWVDPAVTASFEASRVNVLVSPYFTLAKILFRTPTPDLKQYWRAKYYAYALEFGASPYHWY